MTHLEGLRDMFLLLYMDYCGTSILEHNDMNIVSEYRQTNRNTLSLQSSFRISRKLRFRYYEKKVQQLHETDQHSWWKKVQKFLNIKPKPAYSGLDIPANKSAPNTIRLMSSLSALLMTWSRYDQNFWIC